MRELLVRTNIWWVLFLRLLLAMFLFSLCRVGFYLYNRDYFADLTTGTFFEILVGGLRFDLTAVLYTNMLVLVLMIVPLEIRFRAGYQAVVKWIFFVFNGIALAANVSDFIYFKFTGRRTTADIFQQFEHEQNMGGLLGRFLLDYWHATLWWIGLIVLMVWLYNRTRVQGPLMRNKWLFYISGLAAMLGVAYLTIGGIRGGFQHSTRPITLNDAGKYVRDPKDVPLVLNTPFALYRTLGKTKIKKVHYFADEAELDSVFSPVRHGADSGAMRKLNVVVLVLESFSKEFVGFFNHDRENGTYKGYTPFLDSLLQHSRSYTYSLASGRKSIDALPSVIASVPSMGVPYVLSPFSGNKINSLGTILRGEGYHNSFFHGAPNGSMGFQAFMNIAGIEHYYGMTEYGNDADFDGWWGIWDDKFLQFMAHTQRDFHEPFFSAFFSVSSHHPFNVPDEYKARFTGGREPILKCIQYTDESLRQYFHTVSKYPWFKNTLFVITADHTSSNIMFDDSRTARGLFSIPIFFYRPDNSLVGLEPGLVQQSDIMPTVLGYLGYPHDYIAFGRDAFHSTDEVAWNYKDDVYQLYQGDYLMQFDGRRALSLYNYKTDRMLQENVVKQFPDVVQGMEKKMRAIIQQYNNRMVDNKLTLSAAARQ
ncbi:sulfatase-like hydrolase/transferase [Fulvivirgaceae bacterium PWU5]|uniref:Sulfatase-like hydrolase/transferase n=1 Tax=Dawidia cretensis TaxID=2782350 RepID=A0AAP2DWC9_9BACT|nr:LTA synthase family protein [Dawidia cretensis]MBT1707418.1 sulfatase-like hydrolase/transferase [Dawidia cretensis]